MSAPPPSNPPTTHRKAVSHGRGWFEGTMGVISGIGAPRPMTPSEGNRPRTNSWSAPNSPARSGVFPSIHRLPSQDSLDRSIHNESGHGKSVAQIIKDLKKANADLTDQMAAMEVKHMNELEAATRPNVEKQKKVEDAFLTLKKQMAQLEASKIAVDSKVKEKDSQLLKAREEASFHRHETSNLKSQLHQLQNELDDSEGRFDDIEQIMAENEDMKMELEELRFKLSAADTGKPDTKVIDEASSSYADVRGSDYFQQWQDTQGELESHRSTLTATKQDLESLQLERDSWHQEQNQRVIELETELHTKSEKWSMREQEMQSQIQSMEFDAVEDMQNQILERDDIIVSLNDQLADLSAALAQAKEQSVDEEQYRRDEAEDLRILHDAQEEEIVKLRKKLEDAQKELAFRDEEINEQQTTLEKTNTDKNEEIERLQKELKHSQEQLHEKSLPPLPPKEEDDSQLILELEDDLDSARAKIASLEDEIELLKVEMGVENIDLLEREIDDLKLTLEEERQKSAVATAQKAVLQEDIARLQQGLSADATLSEEEKKADTEENQKLLQEAKMEITNLKSTIESMKSSESYKGEKHKRQVREAQLALVALDEEKDELIKKHGELLMAVDREKEKLEKDSFKKIAAIEDELIIAQSLAAKCKEVEAEKDALGKRVVHLEEQITRSATRPIGTTLADEQAQSQLESISEENQELKEKLKDRDTTISALVRSSMGVEEKMANLENDLVEARSSRDDDLITADGEIGELRIEVEAMRLNEQRLRNDLKAMERDLNFAEADATRWQLALQVDETSGADQRFQLAALQRNVAELRDKLHERDDTIEALVAESQTAENESKELRSKVISLTKDLENTRVNNTYSDPELRDEIQRLQTENDMFAGQIVEQDEEIQHLVRELRLRDQSVVELERDVQEMAERGGGGQSREEDAREIQALQGQLAEIQSDLRLRNQQLLQYRQELESIQQQGAFGGDPAMAGDISDLQAMNDDFRIELRELRTELWEAKQAAAASEDLKLELAQAKYAFDEYKRKNGSGNGTIIDLRKELESSKKEVEKMKQLKEMQEASKNYRTANESTLSESFERKSKEKDATIAKLRSELESYGTKSGDMSKGPSRMTELRSENKALQEQFKVELHAKNTQIYALEQTLHAQEQVVQNLRREMNQLQNGLQLNIKGRQGDLDEMQEEIIVMESKAKRQEREISGLRVRLEEAQLDHRAEVSQLRDLLRRKEQEAPIARTVMDLKNEDRLLEVHEHLANLKSHNTKLQEQNLKLNGRLERATIEIQSFASQRGHAVELEQDNRHLRNQLTDMERVLRSYSQRSPTVTTIPLSRVSTAPSQVSSPLPSPSPSPVTVQSSASSATSSLKSKKSNKPFGGLFKKKKSKDKTGETKAMPITPENEDDLHSSF
ncbi:unnamed protein product [Cylindrotheca closterium]|uniref:Uncharacterized protein n=1 Tax=Cylindrotheca closterium TaxID=2856 RepID=A0AAD2CYC9_9STRA|nr:unnamed protein product [Cylindrotheca closterium]